MQRDPDLFIVCLKFYPRCSIPASFGTEISFFRKFTIMQRLNS